ncbi:MAG: transcriptional activator NhaR [Pseudomonadota bacterium]
MRHLNYNHLFYFWMVAREGSINKASDILHITPQTISGQIKSLEAVVGAPLFNRSGRGLILSETGHQIWPFVDEIFLLGEDLARKVKNSNYQAPAHLNVGLVNSIPKLIAFRILSRSLESNDDVKLITQEGTLDKLLADLALHKLDLVLSDRPHTPGINITAYNHLLGTSHIAFYSKKTIAKKYIKNFPESLNDAPMILPSQAIPLRRDLDDWFENKQISPSIIAEIDDSALLKAFGESGLGIFPATAAMSDSIQKMYGAVVIGTADEIKENYYAISPERKLKHPGIVQITKFARDIIFKND